MNEKSDFPEEISPHPWYPQTIPEEFGSLRDINLSMTPHYALKGREYDDVVVGAVISGLYAIHKLAQVHEKQKNPVKILCIERGKAFGKEGLSGNSGGEFTVGATTGTDWLRAALGYETALDFLRQTMLSLDKIMRMAQ